MSPKDDHGSTTDRATMESHAIHRLRQDHGYESVSLTARPGELRTYVSAMAGLWVHSKLKLDLWPATLDVKGLDVWSQAIVDRLGAIELGESRGDLGHRVHQSWNVRAERINQAMDRIITSMGGEYSKTTEMFLVDLRQGAARVRTLRFLSWHLKP